MNIPLTQGKVAIVDDCDSHLSKWKWYLSKGGYAYKKFQVTPGREGKQGNIFLHHAIMGKPINGLFIDHINGVRNDNRRSNLRIVTKRQNQQNLISHRKRGGFVGACFDKSHPCRPWVSRIRIKGRSVYLGRFISQAEAYEKYENAYRKIPVL